MANRVPTGAIIPTGLPEYRPGFVRRQLLVHRRIDDHLYLVDCLSDCQKYNQLSCSLQEGESGFWTTTHTARPPGPARRRRRHLNFFSSFERVTGHLNVFECKSVQLFIKKNCITDLILNSNSMFTSVYFNFADLLLFF